jgi:TupA-like ATPgrasp
VIKFGEFTPYPAGGLVRFAPASFDTELGKAWTLPAL